MRCQVADDRGRVRHVQDEQAVRLEVPPDARQEPALVGVAAPPERLDEDRRVDVAERPGPGAQEVVGDPRHRRRVAEQRRRDVDRRHLEPALRERDRVPPLAAAEVGDARPRRELAQDGIEVRDLRLRPLRRVLDVRDRPEPVREEGPVPVAGDRGHRAWLKPAELRIAHTSHSSTGLSTPSWSRYVPPQIEHSASSMGNMYRCMFSNALKR